MARVSKPVSTRRKEDPVVKPISKRAEKKPEKEQRRMLVSSGSVMLNLACSNTYRGAYEVGRMVNLIGDSSSGKTYLAMEMLAACANDSRFNEYALIYDDTEHALSMDIEELFGEELAERIMSPDTNEDDEPNPSRTIEDFHFNIRTALETGPCIYVLDSFDALTSEQDDSKVDEMMDARQRGKETKGSYGMSKPKKSSELLRDIVGKLEKTNSFLLIISQTRDNIDPMSFEKKTRSGGRALKFYASHEIWLAVAGKIRAKERVVGSKLKAKVAKNKLTGTFREVSFDFRHSYGADDINAAIDFLIAENVISGGKGNAKMKWNDFEGSRGKFISKIEDEGLEKSLFRDVEKTWQEIEESIKPNRKRKY